MRSPLRPAPWVPLAWVLGAVWFVAAPAVAQPANAYRSRVSGFWDQTSTWERYDGSNWVAAAATPVATNASTIFVRNAHTVTVRNALTTDELVVQVGGRVTVNAALTLPDGSGDELTVFGVFEVRQDLSVPDPSTVAVKAGGVYRHARNGGALPSAARTTWEAGSTCEVTGVVNTLPGNLSQRFHHLTWNNPGQTGSWGLGLAIQAINGDFTMVSTGSGGFYWVQNTATPLTVGGNYVQTGGLFIYTYGSGSGTIDVEGDFRVSGGTMALSTSSGIPTLRVAGAFALTGGALGVSAGRAATVVLDGTAPQTLTLTGAISTEDIPFVLDNPSGVTAASDLDLPDDLTVQSGTLDMNSRYLTVGDDLLVNGDLTRLGRLTFDGPWVQTYTYADRIDVPRLVVNKSAGSLTLAVAALDITRGIVVVAGALDLNDQPVTMRYSDGRTSTVFLEGASASVAGDANLSVERAFGTGGDGWRMLAVPITGVPYSTLNGTFHTQGAGWSTSATGVPTLQRLDVAAQDWDPLDGADAAFVPGEGYIFYMYETAPGGAAQLPAVWTVTGPLSPVASVPLGFNTAAGDSHNLVGNPWVANLDWNATVAASTDVGTSYAVWDPSVTDGGGLSGYRYYNAAGQTGAAGPYIPPFQAFSAQATAPGATLVFKTSDAANYGVPVYQGRRSGPSPHVRLQLEGGGRGEAETYLVFDADARAGRDAFDVDRRPPLDGDHATLWFEAEGAPRLAFDGRSMAAGEETYALHVAATVAGTYTLSWPDWHGVPASWRLTLWDRETGREVDLRAERSVTVRLPATDPQAAGGAARFALRVVDPGRIDPSAPPRPDAVRLAPNAPNPFAGATTLRYALPEAGPVRLAVYDALGREVAVLADGERGAGWHTAQMSAAGLASGTYLVRLVAGGEVRVGRMLVAR